MQKASIQDLDNIQLYNSIYSRNENRTETVSRVFVNDEGKFEDSYPNFTIETLKQKWYKAEMDKNNKFWVEAYCNEPSYQLIFSIDGYNESFVNIIRSQDGNKYNVERIESFPETGEIEVTRVVNTNDVGKAISPEAVEGQQYGGSYMGIGRNLSEEYIWDPVTGVLLNGNLLDYSMILPFRILSSRH